MTPANLGDLAVILPTLILVLFGVASLLTGAFFGREGPRLSAWFAAVGFIAAGSVAIISVGTQREYDGFGGTVVADRLGHAFLLPCAVGGLLSILLVLRYLRATQRGARELCGLLALSTAGMAIMVQGADLMVIFFGLELTSLPLYILAAYARERSASREAGVKYFLTGSLASAAMVYGIALTYACFGTTSLAKITHGGLAGAAAAGMSTTGMLPLAGLSLIVVGLAFKAAIAPFHLWCPDVYQGAPTPVTAFFSVGPKVAALGALYRILLVGYGDAAGQWVWPVAVLSAFAMTIGNLGALRQTSLKRMLAYSGIAHAGYMLLVIAAAGAFRAIANPLWTHSAAALAYYALAYSCMTIGVFAVATRAERDDRNDVPIERLRGLGRANAAEGAALALFLVSLTGIPYTAGFLGKWLLLSEAVSASTTVGAPLLWLVYLAVLNSVVSAFYYLRPLSLAFMEEPDAESTAARAPAKGSAWVMVIASAGLLAIAFYPGAVLRAAESIAWSLLE